MTTGTHTIRVPDALKAHDCWLTWKLETRDGEPKPRKVPFYPRSGHKRNGQQGSPEDIKQLASFEVASSVARNERYDGLGFAPNVALRLLFLDFDHCVVDGDVLPEVLKLVSGTYCEFSPSGNGVRAVMSLPDGLTLPDKKDIAKNGHWGFETFSGKGFVTVTGNHLPICVTLGNENTVQPVTPEILALYAERFGAHAPSSSGDANGADSVKSLEAVDRDRYLKEFTAEQFAELESALLTGVPDEDAENRETWINHGMALAALKGSGFEEQARLLWHAFSERCPALYSGDDAERTWAGFRSATRSPKSIFKRAIECGWVNPRLKPSTGTVDDYCKLEDRTDTGNKNLLVRLTAGDLRHVPERRAWIGWDGSRWSDDAFATIAHAAAQRVAQTYHQKAEALEKQAKDEALSEEERARITKTARSVGGWAAHCRNKKAIDNMIALAAKDGRITVPAADLDKDKWLLGVQNGVVDLRTGNLRPAGRDELVTKHCSVHFDPAAAAPRFIQFVAEVTGDPLPVEFDADGQPIEASVGKFRPRPDLADYLQRMLGYCITGSTVEHKMIICVGAGSNGKNVLLDVVQEIVGDYCKTLAPEALMATRHDADAERPSPTLASLAGARMAISAESREGQRLDVALVKRHTGGGFLSARLMRENTFRFEITHKLVLMTNHKPSLDHLDDAMRGRLHLVPFDRTWNRPGVPDRDPSLPDGDKGLMDALRAEGPGILAWLVRGALAYAKHGLEPPAAVKAMTKEYFAEQDPVGRWLAGYDKCHPKDGAGATDLFNAYQQWRRDVDAEGGKGPTSVKGFAKALETNGCVKIKTKTDNRYGLRRKTGEIE